MAVILKMRAIHTTNTTEEKSVGKRWVDLIKIFIESCVISAHGIRSALIVNLNLDSLHVKSLQLRAYAEPTEREGRLHSTLYVILHRSADWQPSCNVLVEFRQ